MEFLGDNKLIRIAGHTISLGKQRVSFGAGILKNREAVLAAMDGDDQGAPVDVIFVPADSNRLEISLVR